MKRVRWCRRNPGYHSYIWQTQLAFRELSRHCWFIMHAPHQRRHFKPHHKLHYSKLWVANKTNIRGRTGFLEIVAHVFLVVLSAHKVPPFFRDGTEVDLVHGHADLTDDIVAREAIKVVNRKHKDLATDLVVRNLLEVKTEQCDKCKHKMFAKLLCPYLSILFYLQGYVREQEFPSVEFFNLVSVWTLTASAVTCTFYASSSVRRQVMRLDNTYCFNLRLAGATSRIFYRSQAVNKGIFWRLQ